MIRIDLHMHTCFCDGRDTPEQMVEAAVLKGMEAVGVCVHSHTPFDESYCSSPEGIRTFLKEMDRLKKEYGNRIRVFAGVEQDLYADTGTEGFDYVIGSVHYWKINGSYYPVDEDEETLTRVCREHFHGDYYRLCEAYYREAASVLEVTGADFVGHLDLVTKFNEGNRLFDESNPRYLAAAEKCIDALVSFGRPFEINTGAMSRWLKSVPNPSSGLRDMIRKRGGRFLLSSDAHQKENLMFAFERFQDEADRTAYDMVLEKN